jgi:hypothetical protein
MKKCPQCKRTYSDETLSFCLDDGALLSAPFKALETNAPTVAIDAGEVPTVAAQEIPTVVANEVSTVAAPKEVPTAVNSPRPTEQVSNAGLGWKVYLAGLLISLVVGLIYTYLLFPFYAEATLDVFDSISKSFNDETTGRIIAGYLLITPLNMFVSALISFFLGFIWWRGKWKWGLVCEIPNLGFLIYYIAVDLSSGYLSPGYYIRMVIAHILYILTALLFAQIGSRLGKR